MYICIYLYTYIYICKLQIFTFYPLHSVPVINFFFLFILISQLQIHSSLTCFGISELGLEHFSADTCCLSVEGAGGTLKKEGACFLSLVPAGGTPGGFRRTPGSFPVNSAGILTDHSLPPALSCKYISELCSEPHPFLSPRG